jgi:hypothetical protein
VPHTAKLGYSISTGSRKYGLPLFGIIPPLAGNTYETRFPPCVRRTSTARIQAGNVLFDCNGVYDQNHYERNSSVVLLGFSLESRSMNQNHLGVLFEMAIHPHGKVVAEQTVGTNVKELIKRWITPGHHETWLRRITCGNCSPRTPPCEKNQGLINKDNE